MEEKFYHTYFKSGNEYNYEYLFRIKRKEIHLFSRDNPWNYNKPTIPSINLRDEVKGISLNTNFSEEENIRIAYQHTGSAKDSSRLLICKSDLNQGVFYPNIYRPIFSKRYTLPNPSVIDLMAYHSLFDQTEYISRLNQLAIIYHDLSDIFKYVEPDNENMGAYGHRIRNNIFLSCTEIDSMFQNLMLKNGYIDKKHRFSTNDYVKTKEVLKLDQFVIFYARYPNMSLFSPFSSWNKEESSKSLSWYDAYNKIKHDRINNKALAKLKNAIEAFSAAIILFIAQYGDDEPFWKKEFGDEIIFNERPHFKYNELYLPPDSSGTIRWTEKQYTFK